MVVYQHRGDLRLAAAVRERFVWGRSYAIARGRAAAAQGEAVRGHGPDLPAVLLLRMATGVIKKRRGLGAFLDALPLTAILTVSWSCELAGWPHPDAASRA